jgi:hypothetical protein
MKAGLMTSNINVSRFATLSFGFLAALCAGQIISDLVMWEPHASLNQNVVINVLMGGVVAVLAYGAWTGSKVYFKTYFALLLFASQVYDSYRWISHQPMHGGGRLAFDLAVTAVVAIMYFGPQVNRALSGKLATNR